MEHIHIQQYFNGISSHQFRDSETFQQFYNCLKDIHNNNLKEGFLLEQKYPTTADLRPNAHEYDESIINVLFESDIPKILKKALGHDLYLSLVQIRRGYFQEDASPYMPWHRDTHFYDDAEQSGKIPPVYKIIYYPKFTEEEGQRCLLFSVGSHLRVFRNKEVDIGQLKYYDVSSVSSSERDFILFNTSGLHHTVPPKDPNGQVRIIYSFCHEHQLKEEPNFHDLHGLYKKKLREYSKHENLYK